MQYRKNGIMSATTQAHTLQEYLDQATPMLMEIPGLPIHMVPSENVPVLWTTNRTDSGYASFVPGNINTGTTLAIKGSFRHSLSSGTCRSGVGIFSGGQFFSKGATTRKAGYPFNNANGTSAGLVAISKLSADLTHYGFIQNYSNSGAITSADITIVAE